MYSKGTSLICTSVLGKTEIKTVCDSMHFPSPVTLDLVQMCVQCSLCLGFGWSETQMDLTPLYQKHGCSLRLDGFLCYTIKGMQQGDRSTHTKIDVK